MLQFPNQPPSDQQLVTDDILAKASVPLFGCVCYYQQMLVKSLLHLRKLNYL